MLAVRSELLSTWSSTAVTVTVCDTVQLPTPKTSCAGETVATCSSELERDTVTLPTTGSVLSETL